jgi:hypothetical protein
VQGDLVAWLPRAAKMVIGGENHASFGIMVFVVYRDAGVRAPGRDPERDPALGRGGGEDAELAQGEREAGGPASLLPPVQQPVGQAGPGDRPVRPGRGGGGGDRPGAGEKE